MLFRALFVILRKDVFVAAAPTGVRLLVHPVALTANGRSACFMPFTYGYAMTIRRAQGSTMELVGLWLDHSYPPKRGYAYVGASRVRRARDLYLMGKVKRTDWLPVDGAPEEEQTRRGPESDTSESNSDRGSEDQGATDSDTDDEDQGATDSKARSGSDDEDQGAADSGEPLQQADEDTGVGACSCNAIAHRLV